MLLLLLSAGLVFSPVGAASMPVGQAAVAPLFFLAERPQVALEPFGLWWGLMGTPTVAFADPTLDLVGGQVVAEAEAVEERCPGGRSSSARASRAPTVAPRRWV
jgi:hypothetical protein